MFLYLDDELEGDLGVQAEYKMHQLPEIWQTNHYIGLAARNPVTTRNEENGTWSPSVSDGHQYIRDGRCMDKGTAGQEIADPAAKYEC